MVEGLRCDRDDFVALAARRGFDAVPFADSKAELDHEIFNHLRHSTLEVCQEPIMTLWGLPIAAVMRYFPSPLWEKEVLGARVLIVQTPAAATDISPTR